MRCKKTDDRYEAFRPGTSDEVPEWYLGGIEAGHIEEVRDDAGNLVSFHYLYTDNEGNRRTGGEHVPGDWAVSSGSGFIDLLTAKAFEEAYEESPQTSRGRAQKELRDLNDRMLKLSAQITSTDFATRFTATEAALLITQYNAMKAYAGILEERLVIWQDK